MSYQERNNIVSLFSMLIIAIFYTVRLFDMTEAQRSDAAQLLNLWVLFLVVTIISQIISHILTHILFTIISVVRTNEEEPLFADERDKLIELKGVRNSYYAFSIIVLIAMISVAMNKPPVVLFVILMYAGVMAQIVGDVSRIYLYRRGF